MKKSLKKVKGKKEEILAPKTEEKQDPALVATTEKGPVPESPQPKMRQIIIETDGNIINLAVADVNGKIELIAILQSLITALNQQK